MSKIHAFLEKIDNKEEAVKEAVKYCHKHGILREFLEIHGSEVLNMLLTEWNTEDAKKVWYEDGREEGKQEIARNLLAEGSSPEFVQKITGLDMETILNLNK